MKLCPHRTQESAMWKMHGGNQVTSWDARDDAPFVTRYTFDAEGCPAPSPSPTVAPSASPTPGATAEPSTTPSVAPSAEAAPELPVTGSKSMVFGGAAVLLG